MKNLLLFTILFISSEILSQTYQPENILIEDPPNLSDQHETAIAIDPNDPDHIMITWNDFREEEDEVDPGYAFSTDGGVNWTTGILEIPGYDGGADPSCSFDKFGNAYYTYVATNFTQALGSIYISRTKNNGPPWDNTVQVSALSAYQDKPYMTIDNTSGDYDGRIYVTWTDFDPQSIGERSGARILFSYSADRGETFSRPIYQVSTVTPNPGPGASMPPFFFEVDPQAPYVQASVPLVAYNGDLYVVWLESDDQAKSCFY